MQYVYHMNWNLNEESIKIKALIEWHRTDTVKLEIELTDNGQAMARQPQANNKHIAKNETACDAIFFLLSFIIIIFSCGPFQNPPLSTHPHIYSQFVCLLRSFASNMRD